MKKSILVKDAFLACILSLTNNNFFMLEKKLRESLESGKTAYQIDFEQAAPVFI
jgi:hypothetical protein